MDVRDRIGLDSGRKYQQYTPIGVELLARGLLLKRSGTRQAGRPAADAAKPAYYLDDVQGLRTLAAILVAIYHVWANRISGGVDIFFVVAAFFLVSTLARREPLELGDIINYYAATARRVVPGTMLVVVATTGAALLVLPEVEWPTLVDHSLASVMFWENYHLAESSVDYLEASLDASPFQQLWALCVQVHVYALFPVLYLASSLVARLVNRSVRWTATAVFAALFAASLGYSVWRTQVSQPEAYFETGTRLWEFAAGALLALWVDRIRLPRAAATGLSWLVVLALCAMGLLLDVSRQFPGYVALLPVLLAAGVIVASTNGGKNRLLRSRPMVWFANMSFAFYLWHWPVLIFFRTAKGHPSLSFLEGVAVLIMAAALAYGSTTLIEGPIRRWRLLVTRTPMLSVLVCGLFLLAGYGAHRGLEAIHDARAAEAHAAAERFLSNPELGIPEGQYVPSPLIASRPDFRECQQPKARAGYIVCELGNPNAERTIVLAGGSHSAQYAPTLNEYAISRGYRFVTMLRGGCLLTLAPFGGAYCQEWNSIALAAILDLRPELVVTLATRTTRNTDAEFVVDGYQELWDLLGRHRIGVLGIRDNPRFAFKSLKCLGANMANPGLCSASRQQVLAATSPVAALSYPHVTFADFSDLTCDLERCWAVRDRLVVYRDDDHLTSVAVRAARDTIWPALDAALATAEAAFAGDSGDF